MMTLPLFLLLLASNPADAFANPLYAAPSIPATVPFVPRVDPGPNTPPPAAPAIPSVAASNPRLRLTTTPKSSVHIAPAPKVATPARPQLYRMYSSRHQTWYTHADPAWLETYVRGLDAVQPTYQFAPVYQFTGGACATGTCPRR